MIEEKAKVEIPTELYEEVKKTVEKSGLYENLEEFAAEAIRWNLENLERQGKTVSIKVNESLALFLAGAVRKTGKNMEDLTTKDVKHHLMREVLGLSAEEFRLLEAVVNYGKEYGSIQEYIKKTIISALAADLAAAGREIERKS